MGQHVKKGLLPFKISGHTHTVSHSGQCPLDTHTRVRVKISGNTGGREGVTVADPTRMMPSHGEATVIVNLLCNIYIVRHISTYRHFHCAIRADKQLNRVHLTCQTPFMESIIRNSATLADMSEHLENFTKMIFTPMRWNAPLLFCPTNPKSICVQSKRKMFAPLCASLDVFVSVIISKKKSPSS